MRKWMRERLKRRKKPADQAPAEAAPSPLQPAYFDAEPNSPAPESEAVAAEAEAPEPAEPEVSGSDNSEAQPATQSQASPSRSGRRRRRGGRGRGRGQGTPRESAPQPTVAQPPSAPATPHPAKGTVILAIGLPGSGKSSWFKRNHITPLSSDMLRTLLFDDATEQRFQDLVFSNLRSMLKARLIARRPLNYVDATNLTPQERHSWIKLAKDFGYEVQAVYFDVPVEVCIERNQKRERKVEDDVMRRMSAKLKAPTFDEGFTKITLVRVKKKGTQQGEAFNPE